MEKYIVCLGDGMADVPLKALNGKTPLEAANIPNMDFIAVNGIGGLVRTIPIGMPPGSDVANMGILGYDPRLYYSGRGPIEAVSIGIDIPEGMIAFRCNLVYLDQGKMADFSAGHITSQESAALIKELNDNFNDPKIQFYAGVSYRNILLLEEKYVDLELTPPHDISGQAYQSYLPKGKLAEEFLAIIYKANQIIEKSEVNKIRINNDKAPANNIWPWSQGKTPKYKKFKEIYGLDGGIITGVDLLKGIAKLAGLDAPDVEGATAFIDTNYENKLRAAFKILENKDFVYIHVEAPDEAGHLGDPCLKVRAIEDFDEKIVGPVLDYQKKNSNVKVMILPDHPTPCTIKTHTDEPVPFSIYYSGIKKDMISVYTEKEAAKGSLDIDYSWELLDYFVLKC